MHENRKVRKRKKESLTNHMALIGITLVVLSLAITVHLRGDDLKQKDLKYQIKEENLEAQVRNEERRAEELEQYRVYVQTKEYIEKVAKEKLGLVNKGETLLKPNKTK
ncbi:MAG: septum formation initiator family protein [Clostridium sp.]